MSIRLVICVLSILAAGCVSSAGTAVDSGAAPSVTETPGSTERATPAPTTAPTTAPPKTSPTTAPPDPLVEIVAGLTVEQKVGQLLMPVLAGSASGSVSAEEAAANQRIAGVDTMAAAVERYSLGGVLYLGLNIVDADQVADLSAGLQAAAEGSVPGVGVLIAVDQEGGRVNRLTDGLPVFSSARSLAPDAEAVRSAAAQTAEGASAQGVNVVLAPVADLTDGDDGVIGDRSFSADPRVAAAMVSAAVQGLQGGGVAAAVKHWPGHGATTLDSHAVLPIIDVDAETWRSREQVPFAAAVADDVAIVLVGHLAVPGLDPTGDPATVSSALIDVLLRDELGFDGVVMTDALDMGAVKDQDRAELAVQSVEAGVDILLATPDVAVAQRGLVEAVRTGRISEERLDASVLRILRLKQRVGIVDEMEAGVTQSR